MSRMHRSCVDRVVRPSHVATEASCREPPDQRVHGKNTLPEGAPEAGDGGRTRHAPATLALAGALLLGSPDVSETHVCSEVCDACGATLKGLPGGRRILQEPKETELEVFDIRYHDDSSPISEARSNRFSTSSSPVFSRTFSSSARFRLRCHSAWCARMPLDAEVRSTRDARFPLLPSTRVRVVHHPRERRKFSPVPSVATLPRARFTPRCFWPLP